MISIIICSVHDSRFRAVAENYAILLRDDPHEIIRISDARSLCEGYNRGILRSRGELLVFSHDDIEILNTDFAERVKDHLGRFDLIGVAGTSRLIRGEWVAAGYPFIFGQVAQVHPEQGYVVRPFGVPGRAVPDIQAVDGLFFAMRRSVTDKITFDAKTFDGFHHYDLDFSFACYLAGFRLAVCNDLHIIHHSWGSQDENWERYARRFQQKYAMHLHPMLPRQFGLAWIHVTSKEEVHEVMRGMYLE